MGWNPISMMTIPLHEKNSGRSYRLLAGSPPWCFAMVWVELRKTAQLSSPVYSLFEWVRLLVTLNILCGLWTSSPASAATQDLAVIEDFRAMVIPIATSR